MTGPVAWDRLPDGWEAVQIRRVASIGNGSDYKDVEVADGGYPVYGSGGEFRRASAYLYDGESVLFGRKGTIDRPLHVRGKFWTVDTMFYTELTPRVHGRFLYYYATTMPFSYYSTSTALPSMTQGDLAGHTMPLPPLAEQRAIADSLDEQTSRIDTLIDKQTQLITTLRERRIALVESATIARPATHRVKHAAEIALGKMLDQGRAARVGEDDRPYVRAADVLNDGTVNLNDLNTMPFSEEEARRLSLRSGDVLVIEGGATVGKPGFLPDDVEGIAFQKTINRVRARPGVSDGRFLFLALSALYDSGYYARAFDTVSFVHLTAEKLKEVPIPLPPLAEQRSVAAGIDERASSIDTLIRKAEQHIALTKERRAALITAAVTGQIDVRTAGRAAQGVA